MSVHHTLLCLFFLSLQAANSSSAHGLELFYGHVGGDVTMECSFSTSGWRELKSFCRENCVGGNQLIQTNSNTAEWGRYRIHYNEQVLSVSISGLTQSDSGSYRCAVGRASHTDVELVVADVLLYKSHQEPFNIEAGSSLTNRMFLQFQRKQEVVLQRRLLGRRRDSCPDRWCLKRADTGLDLWMEAF
ncbi:uncharacterized protein ACNS7B_008482 [Menidia menidia]